MLDLLFFLFPEWILCGLASMGSRAGSVLALAAPALFPDVSSRCLTLPPIGTSVLFFFFFGQFCHLYQSRMPSPPSYIEA